MPLNLLDAQLTTLELSKSVLIAQPEKQQRDMLRKAWLNLCLKYNSTEHDGDQELFKAVTEAYVAIISPNLNTSFAPIEKYIPTLEAITVQSTDLDLLLEEHMLERYDQLLEAFNELEDETAKQAFAVTHRSFFALIHALDTDRTTRYLDRARYLYAQQNEWLDKRLLRLWREMIIRFFGEEYLDDFAYREAIATGQLKPILAKRKLLSPIKWIAAIVNTVLLGVCEGGAWFNERLFHSVKHDFHIIKTSYQNRDFDFKTASLLALKVGIYCAALCLSFYFFPLPTLIVFSLPIAMKLLEALANPVNQIVRPLANILHCDPYAVAVALPIIVGIGLTAFTMLGGFALLPTLLSWSALLLSVYICYNLAQLIYNLYKLNPSLGILQACITGALLLFTLLTPSGPALGESLTMIVATFFENLAFSSSLYWINQMLQNPRWAQYEQIQTSALPKEQVQNDVKTAVAASKPSALHSHRLFKTPKDAEVQPLNDRTVSQTASSLFGKGELRRAAQP